MASKGDGGRGGEGTTSTSDCSFRANLGRGSREGAAERIGSAPTLRPFTEALAEYSTQRAVGLLPCPFNDSEGSEVVDCGGTDGIAPDIAGAKAIGNALLTLPAAADASGRCSLGRQEASAIGARTPAAAELASEACVTCSGHKRRSLVVSSHSLLTNDARRACGCGG
eukprot:scaffold85555_cov31-Tisochrysis_lutea.AAC.3